MRVYLRYAALWFSSVSVLTGCSQGKTPTLVKQFERFAGSVVVENVHQMGRQSVELNYTVTNVTEKEICVPRFEGTGGVKLFREDNGTRVYFKSDYEENHVGQAAEPSIPSDALRPGEQLSRSVIVRYSDLWPQDVMGSHKFTAKVGFAIVFCDYLPSNHIISGSFNFRESTNEVYGNSFLALSGPTETITLAEH
ncbi:MAG: hypothetical protein P8X51_09455 [Maritimibacter sp.]